LCAEKRSRSHLEIDEAERGGKNSKVKEVAYEMVPGENLKEKSMGGVTGNEKGLTHKKQNHGDTNQVERG